MINAKDALQETTKWKALNIDRFYADLEMNIKSNCFRGLYEYNTYVPDFIDKQKLAEELMAAGYNVLINRSDMYISWIKEPEYIVYNGAINSDSINSDSIENIKL